MNLEFIVLDDKSPRDRRETALAQLAYTAHYLLQDHPFGITLNNFRRYIGIKSMATMTLISNHKLFTCFSRNGLIFPNP